MPCLRGLTLLALPLSLAACVGQIADVGDGAGACPRRLVALGDPSRTASPGEERALSVELRDCLGLVPGVEVMFSVSGGDGAQLSALHVLTDAMGSASTQVSVGRGGTVVVTAEEPESGASLQLEVVVVSSAEDGGAGGTGATGGGTGTTGGGTGTTGGGTGTTGGGTGGGTPINAATSSANTLPSTMPCQGTTTASVTMQNTGTTTWTSANGDGLAYAGGLGNAFIPDATSDRVPLPGGLSVPPGGSVTFPVPLRAPLLGGSFNARFQMVTGASTMFGPVVSRAVQVSCAVQPGCSFPQGVPEADFTGHADTSAFVADLVNTAMEQLSGCSRGSDCYIGDRFTDQQWFSAVAAQLRAQGLCAGQHEEGYTDEIAVSVGGCSALWYGYHVYNYGGLKVVWNNGAQRGSWSITPSHCP